MYVIDQRCTDVNPKVKEDGKVQQQSAQAPRKYYLRDALSYSFNHTYDETSLIYQHVYW